MAMRRSRKPVKANPFLPAPAETPSSEPQQAEAHETTVLVGRGPAVPAGGQSLPPEQYVVASPFTWPPSGRAVSEGAQIQFLGLHGGAGTSTLAGLLGERGVDAGRAFDFLVSAHLPVVLVARTNAHGAQLVARAAHQWAGHGFPEGLRVAGVVLVDDAPQVPPDLEQFVRYSARAWPVTWRMHWCEAIRMNPDAPAGTKGLPVWVRALTKSLLKEAVKEPSLGLEEEPTENEGKAS